MGADNNDQEDFDTAFEDEGGEYSYDEESFEGEDFSEDESWDEGSDEPGAEEQPPQKAKKKGGLFNVILVAVALLGGGGFVYLKTMAPAAQKEAPANTEVAASETPSELPQPVPTIPQPAEVADAPLLPVPDTAVADSQAPSPDENSLALLDAPAAEGARTPVEILDEPPMPSPIAATEAAAPFTQDASLPPVTEQSQADFQPSLPSAADIMRAVPPPANTEVPPVQSAAVNDAGALEEKLSVLIARFDSFEGRMAALEAGLHQVSSRESAPAAQTASTDLSGIEDKLTQLTAKINKLEKAQGQKVVEKVAVQTAPETPVFVPAEEAAAPRPASAKNAEMTIQKSEQVESESRVIVTRADAGWVLRSAQPGMAMVSSKSNNETRSVKVGDNLAGLGRIVSIGLEGSRWVVKGTQGNLTH